MTFVRVSSGLVLWCEFELRLELESEARIGPSAGPRTTGSVLEIFMLSSPLLPLPLGVGGDMIPSFRPE
jgi:hypothetical protein